MEESRTKKSARNVAFTLIARVITLILGFISRMIFLRFLSTEYLGINGLFSNVLTVLSFAELGIGNAIQFSLYKPVKEKNLERIKTLMLFYRNAYRIIAAFIMTVGLLLIPALDFIVEKKPDISENLIVIYILFVGQSAVSYLFSYKQTLLQADQNAYVVSIGNSVTNIVQNVLHVVILFATRSYYIYLISTIVCSVLNNVILAFYTNKRYPFLREKNIVKMGKSDKKHIYTNIKALTISKVAGVACNGTDNIIITKILGLVSVGLASNYTLIINTLSGLLYSALSSLTGSVGNLNAEDDSKKKKLVFDQLLMMSFLLYGCVSTCIIVLINCFVGEVWLGTQYLIGLSTIISLVLIAFQSGMNFPAYTFRTTLGYFDEVKYVYVATAVINIVLSIIMGKVWGLSGIFFATTVSKLVTSEIADGYYTYKKGFMMSPILYFIDYAKYWALFALNTVACYFAVGSIPLHGIPGFLVKGIACFIMCNAINILVLCRTRAFAGLKEKFFNLFLKKFRRGKTNA